MFGLENCLSPVIKQEGKNMAAINQPLEIQVPHAKAQIEMWVAQGWLFEKPKFKDVNALMLDLGMRQQQGKWIKG